MFKCVCVEAPGPLAARREETIELEIGVRGAGAFCAAYGFRVMSGILFGVWKLKCGEEAAILVLDERSVYRVVHTESLSTGRDQRLRLCGEEGCEMNSHV